MKHYLDLVPISAKVHRKQNRMSIFCIILAVFLITTIFGMADMFIRSQIIQAKIDNGDFHITVQGITDEEAGLIKKRPDVKAAARYGVLNFNDDKGYTISDKNLSLSVLMKNLLPNYRWELLTRETFLKMIMKL